MSEELEPIAEENSESLYERVAFTVDKGQAPTRIDKWVQARIEGITRNKLQNGIDGGQPRAFSMVQRLSHQTAPSVLGADNAAEPDGAAGTRPPTSKKV